MITKAADCSIRIFMRCLFDNDCTGVEGFENIQDEYVDIAGLSETQQKDLLTAIHNITVRLVAIPGMIQFQCDYFKQYGEPYYDGFWFFKKYGHKLTWDLEKPEDFVEQLKKIESKEKKFESQLDILKKDFDDLNKGKVRAKINGRHEFIKLINRVDKNLDRDKTDMESFGLMVKELFEQTEKQ